MHIICTLPAEKLKVWLAECYVLYHRHVYALLVHPALASIALNAFLVHPAVTCTDATSKCSASALTLPGHINAGKMAIENKVKETTTGTLETNKI